MAVATDGLGDLGDKASVHTVTIEFRYCTCIWIILQGLVSVSDLFYHRFMIIYNSPKVG